MNIDDIKRDCEYKTPISDDIYLCMGKELCNSMISKKQCPKMIKLMAEESDVNSRTNTDSK